MTITVDIYADRMVLADGTRMVTAHPPQPYCSRRLLVGEFEPAVECLKDGLDELGAGGLFRRKPTLRLRVRELSDGGLSGVEQRCLTELGHAAGAAQVEIEECA